ncbi:hypothetical protein ACFSCY_26395, partial [Pseudonocardia aurantiaca]
MAAEAERVSTTVRERIGDAQQELARGRASDNQRAVNQRAVNSNDNSNDTQNQNERNSRNNKRDNSGNDRNTDSGTPSGTQSGKGKNADADAVERVAEPWLRLAEDVTGGAAERELAQVREKLGAALDERGARGADTATGESTDGRSAGEGRSTSAGATGKKVRGEVARRVSQRLGSATAGADSAGGNSNSGRGSNADRRARDTGDVEDRVRAEVERWVSELASNDSRPAVTDGDGATDAGRAVQAARRATTDAAAQADQSSRAGGQTPAKRRATATDADAATVRGGSGSVDRAQMRRWVAEQAKSVRAAVAENGDVAGAVRDVVDGLREFVPDTVRAASKRHGVSDEEQRAGQKKADRADGTDAQAVWAALLESSGAQDGATAERLALTDVSLRSADQTGRNSRGPPQDGVSLLHSSDSQQNSSHRKSADGEWVDGEWVAYDQYNDSAAQTERVLEGRIKADNNREQLAQEKKKVSAGEVSAAQHAKNQRESRQRAEQLAADRAQLSPERNDLIDEVVDGHQELTAREKQLAAEEKKVAAGTVDKRTHARNVAALETQREKVYEATDELMAATDHNAGVVPGDGIDGEGAAAGCGSSGVFVECGAVSENADGKRSQDRCVALAGVSGGCGAQSKSGDNEGSASCTLSGADRGCGSSATSRDDRGELATASARCSGDARSCGQHSLATPDGAAAACTSGSGGSCRSDSTGPATQPGAAPGSRDGSGRDTAASAA